MAQKAYGFKDFIVLPYWANNLNKVMKSLYGVLWIRENEAKIWPCMKIYCHVIQSIQPVHNNTIES